MGITKLCTTTQLYSPPPTVFFVWRLAHTHTHTHTHTHIHTHTQRERERFWKMLIVISIIVFSNFKPKSQGCWFLFWDYFPEIPNLNPFLRKFESKKLNSPLCLEAGRQSILRMLLQGYRGRFGRKEKRNNCIKFLLLLYCYRS